MSHCAFNALRFHYISRDHPNAHELTNHILHPSQEPCWRSQGAPGKSVRRRWGMVPVSPTGTTGSFPWLFQLEWHRELASCSLASIGHGNRQIPANLKCFNVYNVFNTHNIYKWYNWYNYHSQDCRMFPGSIRVRIRRAWIQCQWQQMLRTAAKP